LKTRPDSASSTSTPVPASQDTTAPRVAAGHGTATRVLRLTRALLLLLRGLAVALFMLGKPDIRRRNHHMQRWCASLLDVLGIELDVHGELPEDDQPVFMAANHVSWLDIFVINTICPGLFVAKSEIRRWPVAGWLAARVGTLFIERARRVDTRKVNDRIVARLAVAGERITVFPEGTTTDGSVVLPFHASLFQPAVIAGARVQPIAIRYTDAHGQPSTLPAYTTEVSLPASLWRIAGARGLRAELHFLGPLAPGPATRRELAALAQERVSAVISGSC